MCISRRIFSTHGFWWRVLFHWCQLCLCRWFVLANAIVCAYSILAAIAALLGVCTPRGPFSVSPVAWLTFLVDFVSFSTFAIYLFYLFILPVSATVSLSVARELYVNILPHTYMLANFLLAIDCGVIRMNCLSLWSHLGRSDFVKIISAWFHTICWWKLKFHALVLTQLSQWSQILVYHFLLLHESSLDARTLESSTIFFSAHTSCRILSTQSAPDE